MTYKLVVEVVLQDFIAMTLGVVATTAVQEQLVATTIEQDEATKMFVLYEIVQDTEPSNVISAYKSCTHQN